jgi:hypothetical protein
VNLGDWLADNDPAFFRGSPVWIVEVDLAIRAIRLQVIRKQEFFMQLLPYCLNPMVAPK